MFLFLLVGCNTTPFDFDVSQCQNHDDAFIPADGDWTTRYNGELVEPWRMEVSFVDGGFSGLPYSMLYFYGCVLTDDVEGFEPIESHEFNGAFVLENGTLWENISLSPGLFNPGSIVGAYDQRIDGVDLLYNLTDTTAPGSATIVLFDPLKRVLTGSIDVDGTPLGNAPPVNLTIDFDLSWSSL